MNASLFSRLFILLRWKPIRYFQKLTFFLREWYRFKQRRTRLHWRLANWIGMSQCFERYGTRQKPGNRWLAFWILPNFLEWSFQTYARSFKLWFRDRPTVSISKTRPLSLLNCDYKSGCKPPEHPSPQTDKQWSDWFLERTVYRREHTSNWQRY